MSEPLVSRVADAEEAAERTAEVLATAIDAARTVRGAAHLALSGGSTVARVYELLAPRLPDWREVHLWYGDERLVPYDDPESTHRLATERFGPVDAVWHPVPVDLEPDDAAARYGDELDGTVLDVALNGMGEDGHTGSLFPGHPQVRADGICVAVRDSPKPPPVRVTLTLPKFNEARRILLVVTGEAKAEMLARVLAGPDPDVPASLLHRDNLEIIADRAALGG